MKNLIALVSAVCFCTAAHSQQHTSDTAYVVIPAAQHTWGYNITVNNKLFIHQPSIPGMQGDSGFATKTDAAKVAKLVLQKLHEGQMPPSVTVNELKQLHINLQNK